MQSMATRIDIDTNFEQTISEFITLAAHTFESQWKFVSIREKICIDEPVRRKDEPSMKRKEKLKTNLKNPAKSVKLLATLCQPMDELASKKNNEPRISRLALLFKFSYTRAFCTKSLNLISQFKLLIKLIFQFNFAFCVVVSAEESKAGPKV